MAAFFLMIFLLLVFGLETFARGRVQGTAQYRANVSTVGQSSTFKIPRVLTGATITVYTPAGTTNLATIYSNATGTVKANPFVASSTDARYFFFTDAASVDLRISGVTGVSAFTISDVPVVSGTNPNSTTLTCGGSNDTTLLSAANTVGGTIIIPDGIICASNSQTISASLDIQNGGRLKPITGQTVTLTGPQSGGVWQKFTNATAGLGTVSFAGNKVVTEVYPEWWGGGVGITAATNTAAVQAANDALFTNGVGGEIKLGAGLYDINATLTIGSDSDVSSICIGGVGSLLSGMNWTGATSGTIIRVTRGRNNNFHDFFLKNSSSKGTTIGMLMTGPGTGTQVIGATLTRVAIRGFSTNLKLGVTGQDASEFAAYSSIFELGNIGVKSEGQNSTNLNFYMCQFNSNANYAMYVGLGANVSVFGGSVVETGAGSAGLADFYVEGGTTYLNLWGVRTELNTGTRFVWGAASQGSCSINVTGCIVVTSGTLNLPLIGGTGTFHIEGNTFLLSTIPYIFGDDPSSTPTYLTDGLKTNVTLVDNLVYETATLINVSTVNSQIGGLRYTLSNNRKFDASGIATGRFQDEPNGQVVWPGKMSGESLLQSTSNVDLNTATATTLFTCPTGRTCVITKVVVRNASTSLTTASYSFGWTSAAFNDVVADATHTELTTATLQTVLFPKVGAKLGPSAGTFKIKPNTLQGGAATVTVDVYGYLGS